MVTIEDLLSSIKVSPEKAELILETFVLNTSLREYEIIKGAIESKQLRIKEGD
jgi:hypothetical protein